jgi:hypothetical protein
LTPGRFGRRLSLDTQRGAGILTMQTWRSFKAETEDGCFQVYGEDSFTQAAGASLSSFRPS